MTNYERIQKRKAYYIPLCCRGEISERKCAQILGLAPVSVFRLKKRYKEKGEQAFVNGHKNQIPANKKYTPEFCREILNIYNSSWADAPFAVFTDALKLYHGISLHYSVVRYILGSFGIKPPRSWTTKEKQEHKRRKERAHFGELIQMDASSHDWFMNGTLVSLHGGIDDATHVVTGLYFCLNECRLGYNEVLRQTWTRYGIPRAFYIDRHSSFVSSKRKKGRTFTQRIELSKNESTHFSDLCNELNIEIILALSAQGKGRIERLWQTLQGRLPYIFRFLKIDTIDKANAFISDWLSEFNRQYSLSPLSPDSWFRPVPAVFDLEYKLSVKFNCRTDSLGFFTFHDCDFRLMAPLRAYKHFDLCLSEQFGIRAFMAGKWFPVELAEPCLQDVVSDKMPAVEKDLIGRYLLSDLHSDYA